MIVLKSGYEQSTLETSGAEVTIKTITEIIVPIRNKAKMNTRRELVTYDIKSTIHFLKKSQQLPRAGKAVEEIQLKTSATKSPPYYMIQSYNNSTRNRNKQKQT